MKQIEINSFKGGVYEAAAPSDYTEDQWTQLKGFFLSDINTLKTQWPCQRIGSATGFREVTAVTAGDGTKYLFAIKTDLTVWYAVAPDNSQTNTSTSAISWTALNYYGTANAVTLENTNQHFCGEVTTRFSSTTPYSPAILVNQSTDVTDNDTPIYLVAQDASTVAALKKTKSLTYTVASRSISSLVATLTLTTQHVLRVGDSITVASVGTDYNGVRTITSVGTAGELKVIKFATAGANEALTASTGTVTATVGVVYTGYTPAAPSNITAVQSGGSVNVAWTNEYEGSNPILGYTIYDYSWTQVGTVTGVATTFTYTGTANGAYVIPYNNYGATPFNAIGGTSAPASGVLPRANVAAMWGGQMILGDIEYYRNVDDSATNISMGSTNTVRTRNAITFSNSNALDTFDPLAVFTVGTPETTITGFSVVPQGLLVHTANSNKASGLYLLRGTSAGVITDEVLVLNFTVELIRSQVSSPDASVNPGQLSAFWSSTGTVVFLDDKSAVWHTNTRDVTQLDTYSTALPSSFTSTDNISTWDRYVFASRGTTLTVMRELGNEGGWTQLITPAGAAARSLFSHSNSLYFIANDGSADRVYRYNLMPTGSAVAEYGAIDGTLANLVVTTRPIGDPNLQDKQMWHRIGLRARGNSSGVLKTVESLNASPLAGGTSKLTTTLSPEPTITSRFEKVVPAHGPSTEICARLTMTGYVELEGVTIYVHGHTQRRQ